MAFGTVVFMADTHLSLSLSPSLSLPLSLSLCLVNVEVVDVQYGNLEDIRRVSATMNVTKQIAVLKLGQAPLLYKVGSRAIDHIVGKLDYQSNMTCYTTCCGLLTQLTGQCPQLNHNQPYHQTRKSEKSSKNVPPQNIFSKQLSSQVTTAAIQ